MLSGFLLCFFVWLLVLCHRLLMLFSIAITSLFLISFEQFQLLLIIEPKYSKLVTVNVVLRQILLLLCEMLGFCDIRIFKALT